MFFIDFFYWFFLLILLIFLLIFSIDFIVFLLVFLLLFFFLLIFFDFFSCFFYFLHCFFWVVYDVNVDFCINSNYGLHVPPVYVEHQCIASLQPFCSILSSCYRGIISIAKETTYKPLEKGPFAKGNLCKKETLKKGWPTKKGALGTLPSLGWKQGFFLTCSPSMRTSWRILRHMSQFHPKELLTQKA